MDALAASVAEAFIGLATTAHLSEIARFQESFKTPGGPPDTAVARGLEEMTFPFAATDAQSVMWPAIDFGLSAAAVTDPFASFVCVTAPLTQLLASHTPRRQGCRGVRAATQSDEQRDRTQVLVPEVAQELGEHKVASGRMDGVIKSQKTCRDPGSR